jgi:hypothetical protein
MNPEFDKTGSKAIVIRDIKWDFGVKRISINTIESIISGNIGGLSSDIGI